MPTIKLDCCLVFEIHAVYFVRWRFMAIGNNRRSYHWRQKSGYEWQSGTNFTLYLILQNCFRKFKETWQETSTKGVLSQVCLFWPNLLKCVSLAGKICTRASAEPMHEFKKTVISKDVFKIFGCSKSKTYYSYVLMIFRFNLFHVISYISDLLIEFDALNFIVW